MRIHGIEVQKNEDGYFWRQGPDCGGYYDTAEECADCIRRAMARPDDDRAAEAMGWPQRNDDTPSLGDPWWAHR